MRDTMPANSQQNFKMPPDEAALVRSIAARDQEAFRVAIDEHAQRVHRIAYRMVGDATEAEDLTQEALLRLWDHAPKWSGGGLKLGPWLKRVVVNLSIDRLRIAKRKSGGEVPEQIDPDALADQRIEAEQERSKARAMVEALPDRQRAAIILTYYEELPNSDAAAVLDMNIKAFESLLHRARTALRKSFADREGEES